MLTACGEQQMGTMCANILASSMLPSCSRSSYTTDAAGMTLQRAAIGLCLDGWSLHLLP